MGEEPAAIREEIDKTREQMGETLQQLAAKADVKGRAKGWAEEKKEAVAEKLAEAKETATKKLGEAKDAAAQKAGETTEAVTARLPKTTPIGSNGTRPGGLDVEAMGRAGLSGVKAKVAERVSSPIAARTGLTEDQVEAIIGAVFLGLAVVQFVRLVRTVVRAGRTGETST